MRYENSFCCDPVGAAALIVVAVVVVTLSKTCNKLIKSFGQVGIVDFFHILAQMNGIGITGLIVVVVLF